MTVAELTRSPEVVAKKSGTCPMCPEPIVKGEDYVAKVDGCKKGWMHASCAADYVRHREALDELSRELGEDTGSPAGRDEAGE